MFLHFSKFPLELPSGIDFGPSWATFWSGFGVLFLVFFASKTDQQINDFLHQVFYEFESIWGPKMAPGGSGIARKSQSPPRAVQDCLEDVALICCLSWLRFGTFLDRFRHRFGRFWNSFLQILGSMFDGSGPFRSLVGSIPSSFHAFVLPFLPTSMDLFFPLSFHTFFPSSLDPFINFSPRPYTHSSMVPFILSSIGPFIVSRLLHSTFHRSYPSLLHSFFPSSLGAFNPGPAACAKRFNKYNHEISLNQ